jgi:energy-coupling factor transporter ATP-binding protein EcfA2
MSIPRVFIAPRSGEQSSQNFKKTIEGGYKKSDLEPFLTHEDKIALANHDILMIWGNKPSLKSRWDKMKVNDWVLFYQHGNISYSGKLLYKTHNKALADNLWGPQIGENGESVSWEFVFFLKDLQKVDISYKVMADFAGYKGSIVQGFLPYSETGVENIITKYGSLENFFENKEPKTGTTMFKKVEINSIEQIVSAIKTKPFILLAGISGTGKSRLVRTLAYKTCNKPELRTDPKKPGNFELIPVKPNWHDSSDLMGYVSRINGEKYITTSFLKFIAKAWRNLDVPFLLCLDEMNLAPVEQYFAEYLSIIETRQVKNENIVTDFIISKAGFQNQNLYNELLNDLDLSESEFFEGISIPKNLIVIGTVNMDETTHSFSRKVLDRAMTFEMNMVDLNAGLDLSKNDWSYPDYFIQPNEILGDFTSGAEVYSQEFKEKDEVIKFLEKINIELESTPFKIAYRVRDEFLIYCYYASMNKSSNWLSKALDEMTIMKILSRIEGDEMKLASRKNQKNTILDDLKTLLDDNFKKSNAKLTEMSERLRKSGYTSFWS